MATAKELLTNLADSIRAKSGATGSLSLAQMKTAVDGINVGGDLPVLSSPAYPEDVRKGAQYIDGNGNLQNGEMISISEGSGLLSVNQNGGVDIYTNGAGYVSDGLKLATVSMQSKTTTPATSEQTIYPDSGYYGLTAVTVAAMPTGALNSPVIGINSSTGEITATAGVKTAGYLSQNATTIGKRSLPTEGEKWITPTESEQTAVSAGVYTTGDIKVAAVSLQPIFYVYPSRVVQIITPADGYIGMKEIRFAGATLQKKSVTPSTADQNVTADSNYYGLSTVIVTGDSNLKPENIKVGVTIFGVTGTYEPITSPYSILASTTSFTKPYDWIIRLTLNSQGIADGVFKSGVEYQLVIDGVSKGTVTGNGSGSIYFTTGMFTLTYNGNYIDMDLGTDISPTSIDVIAIP